MISGLSNKSIVSDTVHVSPLATSLAYFVNNSATVFTSKVLFSNTDSIRAELASPGVAASILSNPTSNLDKTSFGGAPRTNIVWIMDGTFSGVLDAAPSSMTSATSTHGSVSSTNREEVEKSYFEINNLYTKSSSKAFKIRVFVFIFCPFLICSTCVNKLNSSKTPVSPVSSPFITSFIICIGRVVKLATIGLQL